MSKLLLIDGNAILHRAYHALPPLTNARGEPTSAVYGFFSMLLNVITDQKPEYLVVCFDRSKPTVRQSLFAAYHQHRPKPSDDFISQIILVHRILEKMNVAVFELDGYEGDDLIGTIATKTVKQSIITRHEEVEEVPAYGQVHRDDKMRKNQMDPQNREVIILTGDRDMLQLVNEHVKVLMPLTGITKTALFDPAAVEGKYGVTPAQFIDYKALIGDPSDGYPGVTGIGPKTAASLLQKYQTFENLYQRIGELQPKIGLKLATDAEQAALAKKLATIITDAPIQFDLDKSRCADFDLNALRLAFNEQGFKSLLTRLENVFGKEKQQLGLLE